MLAKMVCVKKCSKVLEWQNHDLCFKSRFLGDLCGAQAGPPINYANLTTLAVSAVDRFSVWSFAGSILCLFFVSVFGNHYAQGYSRIFCHQQAEHTEDVHDNPNTFEDNEPIVCAVCFNRNSFHGPECTRDGKLIKDFEGLKKETKYTSQPNQDMLIKDSEDNENESIFSPKSRSSLDGLVTQLPKEGRAGAKPEFEESQSLDPVEDRLKIAPTPHKVNRKEEPFSNAKEDSQGLVGNNSQELEMDDTSLMWLGIACLVFCPFVVVIANGMYK